MKLGKLTLFELNHNELWQQVAILKILGGMQNYHDYKLQISFY